MKQSSIFLVLAALLMCSCSESEIKDRSISSAGDGFCTLSVAVPYAPVSKAADDNDGTGIYADRCRLQIWHGDSLRADYCATVNDFKAEFRNIYLRDADNDMFLFWADNAEGGYYDTDTLTRVRIRSPYMGCNDARDAFCRALTGAQVKAAADEMIMLKRPFGQLNIITMDLEELYERLPDSDKAMFDDIVPDGISLSFRMPSTYNVSTGVASDTIGVTYRSKPYSKTTLSMDYIFADDSEQYLNDIVLELHGRNITTLDRVFTNIPIKGNWRTNIRGAILTGRTQVSVRLSDDWCGEFNR